jgi:DNA-binding NarL/FixJ family response regulator
MGGSGVPGGAPARHGVRRPRGVGGRAPVVSHVADARLQGSIGAAAAVALDAVARQLGPSAATFFFIGADGELRRSIVHKAGPPADAVAAVASWERALREVDPLTPRVLTTLTGGIVSLDDVGGIDAAGECAQRAAAVYRSIAVVNDVRVLVRAGDRVVGGITLWRSLRSRRWTPPQLATLDALQPLVEHAYLEAVDDGQDDDSLPVTLTGREREVAQLIAGGATNAEIARALHIGVETAKSHTRAILAKLGVRTRRDVVSRLRSPAQTSARRPEEDAAAGARLLGALVRWARQRVDGVAGGYAVLSGRGSIVHGETALARADGGGRALHQARAIHDALCAPAFARRVRADGATWDVVPTAAVHPRAARLAALARAVGWSAPLLLIMRAHGRAAGLLWVARDGRSRCPEPGAVAELRVMRPLVEASTASLLQRVLARPPVPAGLRRTGLTPREWEVTRASAGGASNAEVARALGISEATVKSHMTRVLEKCGVRSRTQLIALLASR